MNDTDMSCLTSFRRLHLSVLLAVLCLPLGAKALESMDDDALGLVEAQDGLVMEANFGPPSTGTDAVGVSLDHVYWQDQAGAALGINNGSDVALRGYADTVTLYGKGMGAKMSLDMGGYNSLSGLNFDFSANIGTAFSRAMRICDGTGASCGNSLGALSVQTSTASPLHVNLKSSDGVFNQTAIAQLLTDIRNLNLYFNQAIDSAAPDTSTNNQLILKNFNFNFLGTGYAFISDAGGFILQTDCPSACTAPPGAVSGMTLNRVTDPVYNTRSQTLPGLNLEMMYKDASGNPLVATNYTLTNAKGLIHGGVSGDMSSASLVFRGTDATGTTGDASIFGPAVTAGGVAQSNLIMGAGGFALSFGASFTRSGSNPVTLELSHAGNNSYGVQFGNLSPLLIRTGCATDGTGCGALNAALANFSTGRVYLDLSASKKMLIPANTTLNGIPMGASFLTTAADYNFDVHGLASNPNMAVLGVRDADFNMVSRNSRFTVSNDVDDTALTTKNPGNMTGFYTAGAWNSAGTSWGLGLPFYHVDVDSAFYGATTVEQRIGAAFALSTTGRDATGAYTTSILLIDGAPNANDSNNPTNYYVGIRNIDMFMAGQGSLGLNGLDVNGINGIEATEKGLNIDITKFTLALSGQVAAGYLPGAKKKTGTTYSPSNNFTLPDDVLYGLRLKLAGSTSLLVTPGDSSSLNDVNGKAVNYPRLQGSLSLTSGALQLVEPIDNTILGFDDICGTGGTVNACDGSNTTKIGLNNFIRINKDSVDFAYTLTMNPANTAAQVFRVKDVEMFPNGNSAIRQRLGEIAITGGTLASTFSLKPR